MELTVTDFCRRFKDDQRMISACVRLEDEYTDEDRDVFRPLVLGETVDVERLAFVPLMFQKGIVSIMDRVEYAKSCEARHEKSLLPLIHYPFIDKKSNLVFDVGRGGGHLFVAHQLMQVYDGSELSLDTGAGYILAGYGYYMSSISCSGMVIGMKLFDNDGLDQYDEQIMRPYDLCIVSSLNDFQKMKGL